MQIVRSKQKQYIPASHEDQNDPEVWKKILLTQEDLLNGRVQMINWAKLPVGKTFRAHYHEDMQEIFILVKGTATMTVETEMETMGPGDAIAVPIKAVHQMANTGTEDVEYLVIGVALGQNGKTVVV